MTLCRQAGEKPIAYMKYELEDVIVASYKPIGDITGDGLPEEKVGLAYGKMKVDLHRFRLDGKSYLDK